MQSTVGSVETPRILCKRLARFSFITQLWALWWVQAGLQFISVPESLVSLSLSVDVELLN